MNFQQTRISTLKATIVLQTLISLAYSAVFKCINFKYSTKYFLSFFNSCLSLQNEEIWDFFLIRRTIISITNGPSSFAAFCSMAGECRVQFSRLGLKKKTTTISPRVFRPQTAAQKHLVAPRVYRKLATVCSIKLSNPIPPGTLH